MARLTGQQSLLNAALGDYQAKGFRLVAPDDHVLLLYFQDEQVGIVSQTVATISMIREHCQEYLDESFGRMMAG